MPNIPVTIREPETAFSGQLMTPEIIRRHAVEYGRMPSSQWWSQAFPIWGSITIDRPVEVVPEDGYPIETIRHTSLANSGHYGLNPARHVMLFMGGEWVRGGWDRTTVPQAFSSVTTGEEGYRTLEWDRDNQPTRWKPLP